jgi:hypothetical protein
VRFTAGSSVKQSPGSGRAGSHSSCSLGFAAHSGGALHQLAALLLLALFAQRRRGRSQRALPRASKI